MRHCPTNFVYIIKMCCSYQFNSIDAMGVSEMTVLKSNKGRKYKKESLKDQGRATKS